MTAILIVEPDPDTREAIALALLDQGHDVHAWEPGHDVLASLERYAPDLLLLGIRTPEADGLSTLQRVRDQSNVPVVAITMEDHKATKISVLDAGADDVLSKPVDTDELLARVRAILRRAPRSELRTAVVATGDLEIDLEARQVRRSGNPIHLTPTELGLLEELVSNPGRLLTHQHLLQRVWGPSYGTESHYLRVYVAQLRRKLGDSAGNPRLITTEPGIGYRWIADSAEPVGNGQSAD